MKALQRFGTVILLLVLILLAVWQQARLKYLTVESAALREQLAQALAAQEQTQLVGKPAASQDAREAPTPELLRLRGEVAVLRRQLAETVSVSVTQRMGSSALAQAAGEAEVAVAVAAVSALEEQLAAAEQESAAAQPKLADLVAALKLPQGVSEQVATDALSPGDLRSYMEVKRGIEQAERWTEIVKLKLQSARADVADLFQGGSAK